MPTYIFATVRGEDFEIEGDNPEDAYLKLVQREQDNGSLWRLNDYHRNKIAILQLGFNAMNPSDPYRGPVFRVKKDTIRG